VSDLTSDNPATRTIRWFWPALIALAVLHFTIAMLAVRTKSVTYDEPLHTVGGWTVNQYNDFRLEPENPILFERYAGLLSKPDELNLTRDSVEWKSFAADPEHTFQVLFADVYPPPVDIDAMVNRRRPTFALLGALTVIGVGWLARSMAKTIVVTMKSVAPEVGAPEIGALCAAGLLALNPTMLGHSPLVKNDVILALAMTWVASGLWWVMRRASWWSVLWLSLGIAIAPLVKFSGVFAGPVVALVLVVRALSGESWSVIGRSLLSRKSRVGASIVITTFAAIFSYGMLWISYGMRYAATTDGTSLNFRWLAELNAERSFRDQFGILPPKQAIPTLPTDTATRLILAVDEMRLLPEAFSYGLLNVHSLAHSRRYYFLGEISTDPPLAYFPVSFALKEPLANLALLLVIVPLAIYQLRRHRRELSTNVLSMRVIGVFIPGVIFLIIAITGPITIGLRHLLPVYPTIFLAIGLACALAWRWRRWARYGILSLVMLSALESLARAPDFISFCNLAAGGRLNQSYIFCDSNIDWGQDLKPLIRWREKNPEGRLYLRYFGTIDADWYGLENTMLYASASDDVEHAMPSEPGVVAISVYDLRGLNLSINPDLAEQFRKHKPFEILGGSIYLYRWPLDSNEVSR